MGLEFIFDFFLALNRVRWKVCIPLEILSRQQIGEQPEFIIPLIRKFSTLSGEVVNVFHDHFIVFT